MSKQPIANHSELLKLDLQFFSEEDFILPDDYVEDQPVLDEIIEPEVPIDSELDTLEPEQLGNELDELPPTPEQMFKVKFNHEEQEIGYDDAIPLIQKGMNYDKLQERLNQVESDPSLVFVQELAQEQGMDVPEFLDAVRQSREQRKLDELVQQNIPEEYAREMLETRKFREQYQAEQKAKEEETAKSKEFNEFFEFFKQANERNYDPSKDQIPQEVWEAHAQGTPLKFAYMEHFNNELKSQLQTFKQNEQNAKRSPIGSVTAFGGDDPISEDPFLKGFDSI